METSIKMRICKLSHTSIFFIMLLILLAGAQSEALEASITESIGSYTAGCIRNPAALPSEGKGFQVIRLGRGRFYAHPDTINYIKSLASQVDEQLDGILLIGDVAQRTGGPMFDDHSSHQTGLDADILLWQHPIALNRILTTVERAHIHPQSVLTEDETGIDEFKWDEKMGEILKLAASDNRVDRIFVNPLIKKKLCSAYGGEKWLARIRPWYGHDGHFHVRLKCPPGNHLCVPQGPLNIFQDGCGSDLDSWFTADGRIKSRKLSGKSTPRKLPEECVAIVNGIY